ncbi:DDE-type integrase/transposase/recombinase [Stappia sp. F7233]|uniref:DDE-type integrase/transposase/recombinase n=1 Tax=Stappia albiluteola TaxID=2758565 RepID=A0A839AEJ7_9HYPH|nr:DDE-type integrase/transposase/recombinase [Stappia albiluteola]MBA5777441.1 DDE-type integrase/transposase/recombinase [Stappia albiluteola]MBA5777479.1 DDE-type integrase/transposase/recombinase [Stappia albiluteola]MBA5778110.1 DDE-type integrase/transposase/recombinase [Stappia albiluteola]MBA5778113.1 DDE-type integrase/transposase/recombinase [Stappia albiluteola]
MNAQAPIQVQMWFTAQEIAEAAKAGELPGLPATKRGVNDLADREGWHRYHAQVRCETGRGGTITRYHLDLLPLDVRLCYLSRRVGPALTMTGGDGPGSGKAQAQPTLAAAGNLTERERLNRDARMCIVRLADRFRAMLDLGALASDAYFADLYNSGRIPLPDWAQGVVRRVSARTLMRWREKVKFQGSAALACDRSKAKKDTGLLETAEGGRLRAFVLAWIFKNPALSAGTLRDYCEDEFGGQIADRHGELKPLPPVRTFQHFIRKLRQEERVVILKNTNPDKYRSTMAMRGTGAYRWVKEPNQLWQIDASPVDALCTDGRHSMYACIDLATRRLVITLSKTPRASAVGLLIRKAVIQWGVPKTIKTDNGSDFKAQATQRLFSDLHIEQDVSRAYSPTEKGHVERVIGTFQHNFAPQLPGYVGHDVAERKAIEGKKAFSERLGADDAELFGVELTAAELQAIIDEWLEVYYHERPHGGLKGELKGLSPNQAAQRSTTPVARVDERALDVLLMPLAGKDGRRRMTAQGLKIDHVYYSSPLILPGTDVIVRLDPIDMGKVYAFSAEDGSFLDAAVCPELRDIDRTEFVKAQKAMAREMLAEREREAKAELRELGKGPSGIERTLRLYRKKADEKEAAKANVVALPKREEEHVTPAIEAAKEASVLPLKPASPAPIDDRTRSIHEELLREWEAGNARVTAEDLAEVEEMLERAEAFKNVVPIRQNQPLNEAGQRFYRAIQLEMAIASGRQAEISTEELRWLGHYQRTPQYRTNVDIMEVWGLEHAVRIAH